MNFSVASVATPQQPTNSLVRFFSLLLFVFGLGASIATVQAQTLQPYYNVDKAGLWVEGYDPVAYLLDKKAVKGSTSFKHTYQGATFQFASKEHLEAFKAAPTKYLPEYGGYCAYAIGSYNEKVEVDPETFQVKDGKLFLFYNKFFNNTLKDWQKDEAKLHASADKNWKTQKHSK